MLKTERGQDRAKNGMPLPVAVYKVGMEYDISEDLAECFFRQCAAELVLDKPKPKKKRKTKKSIRNKAVLGAPENKVI